MTHTSSGNDSPLHAHLRAATKQPHHALDHHPLLAVLLRAPTLDDYAAALAALHAVYAGAETLILDFLARHPGRFDYTARRKLPALEADLQALGRTPERAQEALPAPANTAELIGMLYTIEGSTRGGQYLHRQLHQHFGVAAPLSFFAGYGAAGEQRWQEFWTFADQSCPAEQFPEASRSAVACFHFIRSHLERCQATRAPRSVAS